MPVKFEQTSIRFWFFLSYLITTVKRIVTRNNKPWSKANVSGTLNFGSSVKTVGQKKQHIPKINVPESISIFVVGSGEQGMK